MSLVTATLFGEEDKVARSIERLKMLAPPEGYYVAFSGGKDSIVTLDLVRRSGVKHDAHYNLTTVDPPELVQFIKREYPDVIRHRPKETMWQLIVRKKMPPTRIARYCCAELKEGGGGWKIRRHGNQVGGIIETVEATERRDLPHRQNEDIRPPDHRVDRR